MPDEGKTMKHSLTHLSQSLRKNQTKEEARLWYQFLRKYPLQFRRQCQFGTYIVDFYCAKAKLIIELDGSGHYEPGKIKYDTERTKYLENEGLTVIRFTNLEIQRYFRQVCEVIDREVKKRV